MKIMICGSMTFSKEMLESQKKLEDMGFEVEVPCDIEKFIKDPEFTTDNHEENFKHCIENDIMRKCFNLIEEADAILVLNHQKGGIEVYVGASSLMEIGLAYHLGKKIFLLNSPPSEKRIKSSHEILITQPIILDGDLDKIKEYA